ncbi:MAG TPA: peptidylprolyl isomerase, partial [Methylophilaceae bacterium]|nr:peptidylprolyl isomerase [Methylophilaceae bacterium]
NTLLAARVVDHKPSATRDFDEVKAGIEDYLKLEKAKALAVKKGESVLADLKQGKNAANLEWIPSVTVDRHNAQGLSDTVMSHVFKIDASKLPAFAGIENGNKGYTLVKVVDVKNGTEVSDDDVQAGRSSLQAALASEYEAAYIESLRKKSDISINTKLLMNSAEQ